MRSSYQSLADIQTPSREQTALENIIEILKKKVWPKLRKKITNDLAQLDSPLTCEDVKNQLEVYIQTYIAEIKANEGRKVCSDLTSASVVLASFGCCAAGNLACGTVGVLSGICTVVCLSDTRKGELSAIIQAMHEVDTLQRSLQTVFSFSASPRLSFMAMSPEPLNMDEEPEPQVVNRAVY